MTTLLLIRHGENDFLKTHRMPGQLPGIHLNDIGRAQAEAAAKMLKGQPIKAIYASPLERAIETAEPLAHARKLDIQVVDALKDTDIGKWQGRSLKSLSRLKYWKVVQFAPARVKFPEGETFYQTQTRVVHALDEICKKHKKDMVAVVMHADPIKLAVAHYIGLPLDHFQRLRVDPASITTLEVSEMGARLIGLNHRPNPTFG